MRKLCLFLLIAGITLILSGFAKAGSVEIKALQGKATDGRTPDDVIGEARLATRSGTFPDAKKSWLQFDLSALYAENPELKGAITNAKLVFYGAKSETSNKTYAVNGLNDAANLEDWSASTLTWNNAPGNDTTHGKNLNTSLTTQLYTGTVLPPCLDTLTETPEADRAALTAFVNADTDGKLTFIFTAGGTTYLWNAGAELEPVLVIEGNFIPVSEGCPGVGIPYSAYADVSCRAEGGSYVDTNRSDSSKLSVRASSNGIKSWIKFDISDLSVDPNSLKSATLRITLHAGKGGSQTVNVSVVNDEYKENIGWAERDITWNNAPGNLTTDLGLLDSTRTTLLGTVSFTDGVAGQQFYIDVLPALQADTDGILQFVLHNSPNLLDFATHDHGSGQEYWPRLDILEAPAGADDPYPCPGQVVPTSLVGLSWTNPDPNDGVGPVVCTVYFGTEPNRPQMDSITLVPDGHSVLLNAANFPTYGTLNNLQEYHWTVDCYDTSTSTLIPGLMWDFFVNDNDAPVVNAGPDQVVWGLPKTIDLAGTVIDDGLPNPPGIYTVKWTQASGSQAVTPSPDDTVDASVTISVAGVYEFMLTADDSEKSAFDTVRVVVGTDACEASHLDTGAGYDAGDVNEDCIVNLEDFALLISANWLVCTDTLTHCGQ